VDFVVDPGEGDFALLILRVNKINAALSELFIE
jgi:hypothetical protein